MPAYQLAPTGNWHPGGCSRRFVNVRQRPGISQDQLSVGRNLLPGAYIIRSASDLDNTGLGILPLLAAAIPAVIALIPAAVGAGVKVAGRIKEKKAAKKKKKPAPSSGGERWKWAGGHAGDVDAEGHVYGELKSASVGKGLLAAGESLVSEDGGDGGGGGGGGGGKTFIEQHGKTLVAGGAGLAGLWLILKIMGGVL